MKQTLLLMMMALGMCSINVSAQEKEYKVEDDGFEWYKISIKEDGKTLYGAQDRYGNTIVPAKYRDDINYDNGIMRVWYRIGTTYNYKEGAYDTKGNLIIPTEYCAVSVYPVEGLSKENSIILVLTDYHGYAGYYNLYGKCIIPVSRKYKSVFPEKDGFTCRYEDYGEKGKVAICDASGKVVYETKGECERVHYINDTQKGKYVIVKDGKYFVDRNDNILWEPRGYSISWLAIKGDDVNSVKLYKNGKPVRNLTQAEKNKVFQNGNLFIGNQDYFANNKRLSENRMNHTTSVSSNSSSSSSSSLSNNNSGGGTTTIVVEHQHTPQPMQEWQQCTNCWGEGKVMCLGACGGTGTYYVGDRLHICNSCGGKGKKICPNCSGQGGKYITVYK